MNWFNMRCDACGERKPDVKGRLDWAPPRPLCDACWKKWWDANKDQIG